MAMSAAQAHKEHVLAVSRDFISQPRLSKCSKKISEKRQNLQKFKEFFVRLKKVQCKAECEKKSRHW